MIDCWSDVVHRYNGGQENPENSGVNKQHGANNRKSDRQGEGDHGFPGSRPQRTAYLCSGWRLFRVQLFNGLENQPNILDKTYTYDGLRVFVDQASLLYLDGAEVDFVETLEGSGFKFNNHQV